MSVYKQFCQISKEVRNLLRGEYPSFVFSSHPRVIDFIPIFVYHRVDPVEFEADLHFLNDNGYRAVTGEEYLAWLEGKKGSWKRCVLLTFDDGMSSVFIHGLPLLKKYDMHAMVFLVTGYLNDHVSDVESGCRDNLWNPLLSWEEIRCMKDSECFSFGSHTCFHHPAFTSDDIIDFVNPESNSMLFDIPVDKGIETKILRNGETRLWGAPIYRHKHFMQTKRIYSNEVAGNACMDHVQKNGGASFFNNPSWRSELKDVESRYHNGSTLLAEEEISDMILTDLRTSRETIEQRLECEISQLCYPAGAGSDLSVRLSKKAGYRTNMWQTLPGHNKNYPGCDPYYLVRLKNDFLRRLPGTGRRSLVDIYLHKAKRRMEGKPYF
jgi:Predicted xylanase/chitin deacetylase